MVEDDQTRADAPDLIGRVADEEAGAGFFHHIQDPGRDFLFEVLVGSVKDLVQNQKVAGSARNQRKTKAGLHSVAVKAVGDIDEFSEIGELEGFFNELVQMGFAGKHELAQEFRVLASGELGLNADRSAEDRANVAAHKNASRGGFVHPRDTAAEGGLADAIDAHESDGLSAVDREAEILGDLETVFFSRQESRGVAGHSGECVSPGPRAVHVGVENEVQALDADNGVWVRC